MLTVDQLNNILLTGESLHLECKAATADLPRSIWETYSAFANTLGGRILLGVVERANETDPSRRFTIEGVERVDKIVSDFWNTINSDKVSANILQDHHMTVLDVDGKNVVCIDVPQAHYYEKPVFLSGNPYKNSYKRNHEGDYHCSEEEVKAMIRDASQDGNDGVLLEGFNMDDIDPDTLRGYRSVFQIANVGHPWNVIDDDKIFLKSLGGYAVDRRSGKEGLTAAGLMMFGKGESIRERFANFRMDYVDMSGLLPGEYYRYRLTYDGRWENNFYQFFRTVINKLTIDMPCPFKLKDGLQRIDDTPQMAAVREALTNAIIHCDIFRDAGVLRIEKHDDHFVMRNPGVLKLPIEQVLEGGVSSARNPRMQHMLRMIGFGENLGSGYPRILDAWKQAGWPTPQLINNLKRDEVELRLYIPTSASGANVGQIFAGNQGVSLNENQTEADNQRVGENNQTKPDNQRLNSSKNQTEADNQRVNTAVGQKSVKGRSEIGQTDVENRSKVGQKSVKQTSRIGQRSVKQELKSVKQPARIGQKSVRFLLIISMIFPLSVRNRSEI